MCIVIRKTKKKSFIGYKVVIVKNNGSYTSLIAGCKFENGSVKKLTNVRGIIDANFEPLIEGHVTLFRTLELAMLCYDYHNCDYGPKMAILKVKISDSILEINVAGALVLWKVPPRYISYTGTEHIPEIKSYAGSHVEILGEVKNDRNL